MTVFRTAAVSSARGMPRILARATTVLLIVTVTVDALFLLGLLASNGTTNPVVNVGLSLASQWAPVAVFWLVAARTGFRRTSVVLAAAGVTFSAVGDTYYTLAMDADGYLAFPSPADAGYLLFYPLMVATLIALVGGRLRGVGGLILLETAVATVGASAVLAVVLDPVIGAALASGSPLADLIALAYPLFDLLLLAVIAGIASVSTVRTGRRWWAMITGLAIFAVADVVYAVLEGQGAYLAGTPLDATWAIGLAFITWWVAGVSGSEPEAEPVPRRRRAFPLPAVAVFGGLAVLVAGTLWVFPTLSIVLAAVTVGLGAVPIIFRQAMLGRMLAAQEQAVARLTELDQAKTDILVTVNHEFRTPLTSITGHVDLLLDGAGGDLEPAAVEMLHTIERNGERLQRLIDETFAAAQLHDGDALQTRTSLDVGDLVTGAVSEVEARATSRRIRIAVAGEPSARLEGDPAQLGRAILNLLDNAVKFSTPGGLVEVTVGAESRAAVIRITDHGMGIPPGDLDRLFTRFFRASNVQNAAIPGVGLGLSISRQIVKAHGGTIGVESALGGGTTMTVRLPSARTR
jgi:signal transduction histidine kinase